MILDKNDFISRAEAIGYIHERYCVKCPPMSCQNCIIDLLKKIIDDIPPAKVISSDAWVSVHDRLPKRNEKVVVSDGIHTWDVGAFQGLAFGAGSDPAKWAWKKNTVKDVKYWIKKESALPDVPREEK